MQIFKLILNLTLFIIIILLLVIIFKCNEYERITDIFKNNFSNKKYNILDLGCGACCNSKKLENLGHRVVSLDVVDKHKCKKPIIYDGRRIPYPDNSFDIILVSFVLHHVLDWNNLLDEIKRVSKKYVIIVENTPENDLDRIFTRMHSDSDWGGKNCDKCFKTNDEWLDIFKKHNFKIQKVERINRMKFPFSAKPYIYPVPSMIYILKK